MSINKAWVHPTGKTLWGLKAVKNLGFRSAAVGWGSEWLGIDGRGPGLFVKQTDLFLWLGAVGCIMFVVGWLRTETLFGDFVSFSYF